MKTETKTAEKQELARLKDVVEHWKRFSDALARELSCYCETSVMLSAVRELKTQNTSLVAACEAALTYAEQMQNSRAKDEIIDHLRTALAAAKGTKEKGE